MKKMRPIKFRGFSQKENKWIYGCGVFDLDNSREAYLITNEGKGFKLVEIEDKATIGQFTGMQDKNGTDIYEGDIVSHPSPALNEAEIKFEDGLFLLKKYHKDDLLCYCYDTLEIIGNIHE